ncbi:MAG: hypothetical protein C0614_02710, partial [Desulfuromonas sp.]
LHGLQLWVALPEKEEQCEPEFCHYEGDDLPTLETQDKKIRVMIGEAYGLKSNVKTKSPTLYVDAYLKAGSTLSLPENLAERALYLVSGNVTSRGTSLPLHSMAIFNQASDIKITAHEDSHLIIIGGTPLGKRTVWWNLVSSRRELIEQAKADWQAGQFPMVPGETESIPLP